MWSSLFVLVGFAMSQILRSAGVGFGDWQFYGIAGCLIASTILTALTMK